MEPEILLNVLTQYGLAGLVIFIFYKLISTEIKNLEKSINDLNESIKKLAIEFERSRLIYSQRKENIG